LASNLAFYARTKHIELDYHLVQKKQQLDVQFLSSKDLIDDVLTKPLSPTGFNFCATKSKRQIDAVSFAGRIGSDDGIQNSTIMLHNKSNHKIRLHS
jgi:hypothetical protein